MSSLKYEYFELLENNSKKSGIWCEFNNLIVDCDVSKDEWFSSESRWIARNLKSIYPQEFSGFNEVDNFLTKNSLKSSKKIEKNKKIIEKISVLKKMENDRNYLKQAEIKKFLKVKFKSLGVKSKNFPGDKNWIEFFVKENLYLNINLNNCSDGMKIKRLMDSTNTHSINFDYRKDEFWSQKSKIMTGNFSIFQLLPFDIAGYNMLTSFKNLDELDQCVDNIFNEMHSLEQFSWYRKIQENSDI